MSRNYYLVKVNRDMYGYELARSFVGLSSLRKRDSLCISDDDGDYAYYSITRDELIDELAKYLLGSSIVYTSKSDIKADVEGAMAEYNAKFGPR